MWLLQEIAVLLAPVFAIITCNTSLTTGKLPSVEKHAIVSARLKQPTLDSTDLQPFIHAQIILKKLHTVHLSCISQSSKTAKIKMFIIYKREIYEPAASTFKSPTASFKWGD